MDVASKEEQRVGRHHGRVIQEDLNTTPQGTLHLLRTEVGLKSCKLTNLSLTINSISMTFNRHTHAQFLYVNVHRGQNKISKSSEMLISSKWLLPIKHRKLYGEKISPQCYCFPILM